MNQKRGFTLIELLVVISILAILAAVVFSSLQGSKEKGYNAKVKNDIQLIQLGIQQYYQDNGGYPVCPNMPTDTPQKTCCIGGSNEKNSEGKDVCYFQGDPYTGDLSTIEKMALNTQKASSQVAGVYIPYFGETARVFVNSQGVKNGPYVYHCKTIIGTGSEARCMDGEADVSYATYDNNSYAVSTITAGDVEAVYIPRESSVYESAPDQGVYVALVEKEGCTTKFDSMGRLMLNWDPDATRNDGSCVVATIYGCMDSTASNYKPLATYDDNSVPCIYPPPPVTNPPPVTDPPPATTPPPPIETCGYHYLEIFYGGTRGCDYNGNWSCDVYASCVEPYLIYGCMTQGANNYNSSANRDDGSCTYTVYGCTSSNAINYNPSANTDDGSCTYTVYGCTSGSANNYNPSANTEDGSCTYDASGS